MATVITKELNITIHNSSTYCTAVNCDLDKETYAFRKYLNGSTDGYATLNDAAKELLFPSGTAHPFKADSVISCSRSGGTCTVALQFGGTAVHTGNYTSITQQVRTSNGITNAAVTGSTKSTQIRWHIHGPNFSAQRVKYVDLKLYFNQYACAANAVGDGIASVGVDKAEAYDGDSVTFTATLKSGATFHGWFSDAACTQLLSTSRIYTTAASDLTLYAKATREVTGTGSYVKADGVWCEVEAVYKKINGVWVLQSDIDAVKQELQNGNYKLSKV